jgi:molecular chaperone DnaK
MLSKDDVDKMVRDAESHAAEDKARREEVETRNQAEQLTYQAERTLKDLGDKVSSEDKAQAENQIGAVREALKGSDLDAVRSGAAALADTLSRISTAAYQAAGAGAGSNGTEGGEDGQGTGDGASSNGTEAGAGEETVEGEFKEV